MDGASLSQDEINALLAGMAAGEVPQEEPQVFTSLTIRVSQDIKCGIRHLIPVQDMQWV